MVVEETYIPIDEVPDGNTANDGLRWTGTTWEAIEPVVPIGAVIAWAKTISGVPALSDRYVECDGSVLSDAASPLDGQTIPDLNGSNNFLRGASASGGTGGVASHDHSVSQSGTMRGDAGSTITVPTAIDFNNLKTEAVNNEPPYYEIVWIMRVK